MLKTMHVQINIMILNIIPGSGFSSLRLVFILHANELY